MNTELFEMKRREYIAAMMKLQVSPTDRNAFYRVVFHGVGMVTMLKEPSGEEVDYQWNTACYLLTFLSQLTPTELTMIFPIDKSYDGEKYGVKDYFYTIDMIDKHGWNNLITNSFEFLWDYENSTIFRFIIKLTDLMDAFRQREGKRSIASEFMDNLGVASYRLYKTPKGEEFMIDKQGRTFSIAKKRPKHLRVVR